MMHLIALLSCLASAYAGFRSGHQRGIVKATVEASGLAASKIWADVLYTHDDSGGKPEIYAISSNSGRTLATYKIAGVYNCDWEDMACAAGYCYIGEFGSGCRRNKIYVIKEPSNNPREGQSGTLSVEKTISFSWSERDCETLMVDKNSQLYLVSKVPKGRRPRVYYVPPNGGRLTQSAEIPLTSNCCPDFNGGDISSNGEEILLRTYNAIYYWYRGSNSVLETMARSPDSKVPYTWQRQDEAVCWSRTGRGYFTLAEGKNAKLYFYWRY